MGAPPPTAQDPGTAPERSDARVVVIGTGLSGSLAALALARRGLNVLLVGPEPGQVPEQVQEPGQVPEQVQEPGQVPASASHDPEYGNDTDFRLCHY